MPKKNILRIAIITALILLIPLVAMQFSDDVDWKWFDFIFIGALLFGAGIAYELMAKRGSSATYKFAVAGAVGTGLLLLWVNAAVGLIGSENNDVNMLYPGVVAVAFIGALLARFQPRGMVWALFVAALA